MELGIGVVAELDALEIHVSRGRRLSDCAIVVEVTHNTGALHVEVGLNKVQYSA